MSRTSVLTRSSVAPESIKGAIGAFCSENFFISRTSCSSLAASSVSAMRSAGVSAFHSSRNKDESSLSLKLEKRSVRIFYRGSA